MNIIGLAKRVKRGARLLDKKLGPGWRTTMRRRAEFFNLKEPQACILGTLEHFNGRMKTLGKRRAAAEDLNGYYRAAARLNIEGDEQEYGFDLSFGAEDGLKGVERGEVWQLAQDLWRAEFEA